MVEQVLDGLDATLGELDRDPFPHPLHKLYRCRKFQHSPMLPTSVRAQR
jgi:hypothetical protein